MLGNSKKKKNSVAVIIDDAIKAIGNRKARLTLQIDLVD